MLFGIGGSTTDMIVNRFGVGWFSIEIIIPDKPVAPVTTGSMGVWIPKKKEYREVTFVIRYRGKVWYKKYKWTDNFINAYIRVTGVINKIISNIKFVFGKIKSTFKGFRIKR